MFGVFLGGLELIKRLTTVNQKNTFWEVLGPYFIPSYHVPGAGCAPFQGRTFAAGANCNEVE